MHSLQSTNRQFSHYPCARYATDVTFQLANRPSGNMQEGKVYYSGKHKAYGYKTEVSVLPTGQAIGCTRHYPGSKLDIDIFRINEDFHMTQLEKLSSELGMNDNGPLLSVYKTLWAVLCDKGYQGAAEFLRAITPHKILPGQSLTNQQKEENRAISSDRVIVENYFGRLCGNWNILSAKFKWAEQNYDHVFKVCLAFTNCHIRLHPLREADGVIYRQLQNRIASITRDAAEKRRRTQERYRERRKRRLDAEHRAVRRAPMESLPDSDDDILSL